MGEWGEEMDEVLARVRKEKQLEDDGLYASLADLFSPQDIRDILDNLAAQRASAPTRKQAKHSSSVQPENEAPVNTKKTSIKRKGGSTEPTDTVNETGSQPQADTPKRRKTTSASGRTNSPNLSSPKGVKMDDDKIENEDANEDSIDAKSSDDMHSEHQFGSDEETSDSGQEGSPISNTECDSETPLTDKDSITTAEITGNSGNLCGVDLVKVPNEHPNTANDEENDCDFAISSTKSQFFNSSETAIQTIVLDTDEDEEEIGGVHEGEDEESDGGENCSDYERDNECEEREWLGSREKVGKDEQGERKVWEGKQGGNQEVRGKVVADGGEEEEKVGTRDGVKAAGNGNGDMGRQARLISTGADVREEPPVSSQTCLEDDFIVLSDEEDGTRFLPGTIFSAGIRKSSLTKTNASGNDSDTAGEVSQTTTLTPLHVNTRHRNPGLPKHTVDPIIDSIIDPIVDPILNPIFPPRLDTCTSADSLTTEEKEEFDSDGFGVKGDEDSSPEIGEEEEEAASENEQSDVEMSENECGKKGENKNGQKETLIESVDELRTFLQIEDDPVEGKFPVVLNDCIETDQKKRKVDLTEGNDNYYFAALTGNFVFENQSASVSLYVDMKEYQWGAWDFEACSGCRLFIEEKSLKECEGCPAQWHDDCLHERLGHFPNLGGLSDDEILQPDEDGKCKCEELCQGMERVISSGNELEKIMAKYARYVGYCWTIGPVRFYAGRPHPDYWAMHAKFMAYVFFKRLIVFIQDRYRDQVAEIGDEHTDIEDWAASLWNMATDYKLHRLIEKGIVDLDLLLDIAEVDLIPEEEKDDEFSETTTGRLLEALRELHRRGELLEEEEWEPGQESPSSEARERVPLHSRKDMAIHLCKLKHTDLPPTCQDGFRTDSKTCYCIVCVSSDCGACPVCRHKTCFYGDGSTDSQVCMYRKCPGPKDRGVEGEENQECRDILEAMKNECHSVKLVDSGGICYDDNDFVGLVGGMVIVRKVVVEIRYADGETREIEIQGGDNLIFKVGPSSEVQCPYLVAQVAFIYHSATLPGHASNMRLHACWYLHTTDTPMNGATPDRRHWLIVRKDACGMGKEESLPACPEDLRFNGYKLSRLAGKCRVERVKDGDWRHTDPKFGTLDDVTSHPHFLVSYMWKSNSVRFENVPEEFWVKEKERLTGNRDLRCGMCNITDEKAIIDILEMDTDHIHVQCLTFYGKTMRPGDCFTIRPDAVPNKFARAINLPYHSGL